MLRCDDARRVREKDGPDSGREQAGGEGKNKGATGREGDEPGAARRRARPGGVRNGIEGRTSSRSSGVANAWNRR